jgi:hypothetical protein
MKTISFINRTFQSLIVAYSLLKQRYKNKIISFTSKKVPYSGNLYFGSFVIS